MRFKKDEGGALVLDDNGDPIAVSESGDVIPLDKVVSLAKHQRIEGERDEYKSKVEELTGQIGELKASAGDAETLKAKVTELTKASEKAASEFEGKMAARSKEFALETALLKAGCRDTKAARAHVDMEALKLDGEALTGLDLDTFKKDKPYLFEAGPKVDTGAALRGPAGSDEDAQLRSVMGLEAKKE